MSDIIVALNDAGVSDEVRAKVYPPIIEAFENHDCDTLSECDDEDAIFKQAMIDMHPDWYSEDSDE